MSDPLTYGELLGKLTGAAEEIHRLKGHAAAQGDQIDALTLKLNRAERERDRLAEQVKRAEAVCVLLGWTPSPQDTDRQKALHQLWSEWATTKPDDFIGPTAHPELSDEVIERLARKRDEIRARTLAAIRDTESGS